MFNNSMVGWQPSLCGRLERTRSVISGTVESGIW